jgi:hypothetical protein
MLSAMRQLFNLLIDSFVIWSRNFTLVYIFLLALFVFSILLGQAGMPSLDTRWVLLGLIMLLIFAAIMAGWFNMVAAACTRFLDKPREIAMQQTSPLDALTLFRAFLPGIGRFFPTVAMGYLIQLSIGLLLLLATQPLWGKNAALLEKMMSLDIEARIQMINSLSHAEKLSLGEFSLMLMAGMLGYGLFSLLIMLWPAFVLYYGENAFKACLRSMIQFVKDPLWMLGISLFFMAIKAPLFLLSSGVAPASPTQFSLAAAGIQLISFLVEIYTAIVIFVYVYQRVGKPTLNPEESVSENLTDEPPTV